MSIRYDVIVAGLGAMGSATAAHLAMRGQRVLGLERWVPGHRFGSSHGDSRIIREMYFEHPMYVPLLRRAYELWAELGERVGHPLLHITGGLMIGREDGMLVTGTLESARTHGLPHELLSASEAARRYPAFHFAENIVAVRDPRAGYLDPEQCNAAHLHIARENGAELRFEEPVVSWDSSDSEVSVRTSQGTCIADRMVLAVGAYTPSLMNASRLALEVERQAVFWFNIEGTEYDERDFPIYAFEYEPGEICYGFPRLPRGTKASVMHRGRVIRNVETVDRVVHDDEVESLRRALGGVLPALSSAPIGGSDVCLFTNTPDRDFVIDIHPEHPRVVVSSACSGHGFKFASVVGEIQADLSMHGQSPFDLRPFRIGRAARLTD